MEVFISAIGDLAYLNKSIRLDFGFVTISIKNRKLNYTFNKNFEKQVFENYLDKKILYKTNTDISNLKTK